MGQEQANTGENKKDEEQRDEQTVRENSCMIENEKREKYSKVSTFCTRKSLSMKIF